LTKGAISSYESSALMDSVFSASTLETETAFDEMPKLYNQLQMVKI